jgi:hypothetical protein
MLLNFLRCLNILLLQTSKTDNNALDIDVIYNLKLNAKFQWPPIMPKQRERILARTAPIDPIKYLNHPNS